MRAERGEGRRQQRQQVRGRREREPLRKAGKMLCLKKRRTYSFTQGARNEAPRRSRKRSASAKGDAKQQQSYSETLATLPRKITPREERSSAMVLTVTEDTPADMLAGSMELLVQMPRDHHVQMQRVTVQRSTPMMDLLVQIATAHKLAASSYTLQAIGERDLVLPHQPNTPIGALDALQVKLLPKQGTFLPRKSRQPNQPFETTFRLQVHLPRNQLYVSRVSPKTNLGEILDEVCREKNLDRNKYELRHPANLSEPLDLSLSLQDYHLQEVTLCPRQPSRAILGSALSSQDIMALQKQEECRRQQARHSVFNFMFKKSKESSLSTDSLGNRSVSPAHSDETARSNSPVHHIQQQQIVQPPPPPARPQRKRRPAPKPPTLQVQQQEQTQRTTVSKSASETSSTTTTADKDKVIISHSRNSSDSSGYHEASVLSDNPDNGRMPETLPRRGRMQGILEAPRKLAHTSQASKSLGNLAIATSHGGTLSRGISNTSLSSAGQRKKRAAPAPPMARPLPSAISAQGLERIVDSDESLTSDMDLSKPSSDIDVGVAATGASSKASSDIACHAVHSIAEQPEAATMLEAAASPPPAPVEPARVVKKEPAPPVPKPRKVLKSSASTSSLASSVDSPILETPPRLSSNSPTPSAEVTSFGLPSLTEDEREEIAMAIDSIVEAAQGHDDTESSVYEDAQSERRTSEGWDDGEEVFIDSVPMVCIEGPQDQETGESTCLKVPIEKIQVPLAFRDPEDLDVEKIEVQLEETEKKDSDVKEVSKQAEEATIAEPVTSSQSSEIKAPSNPSTTVTAKEVKFELSDGPSCAVISTIPKCDHLEPYTDSDFGLESLNSNDSGSTTTTTSKKRGKVVRSQSEMSHFEFGPAEKHGRHLTSNGEAFTFALNPNLGEAAQRSIEATIAGAGKAAPTDTDILLQKVSDTLSHSLTPPSPPPTPEDASLEVPNFAISTHSQPPKGFESEPRTDDAPVADSTVDSAGPKESKAKQEEEEEVTSTLSANNLTLSSQQDTSDYVSASGEDLSIGDWEYQIPAPPSAFRDDESQATAAAAVAAATEKQTDVSTIKELIAIEAEVHHTTPENPPKAVAPSTAVTKQSASQPKSTKPVVEEPLRQPSKTEITVDAVDFCPSKPPKIITPQISNDSSTEVKKAEVISELETKINSKKPIVEPPKDESDAPKIAPVENNLSNFTITTYSRQKSLDIFEQMDQHQHNQTRVLSTFATLTRGRSSAADFVEEKNGLRSGLMKNAQSMERVSMPLVEERVYFAERNEIVRDKPSVHRSQSYIVLSSNEKFQNRTNEVGKNKDEKCTIATDERPNYELNNSSKKFTSLANVNSTTNEVPRHKEKFSQWRENILRKHEEPSKEKQLQSLQVLKSILPQLKNAQANEENGYKSDNFNTKKRQETHQDEVPDSSMVSTSARSEIQMRASNSRRNQEPAKRYTYGGPPSVSLGSWSERPSVNVQIKTDTDYKFGSKNSASGARTVVSLNSGDRIQNGGVAMERKEPVNVVEKEKEREEEPRVDTTSVNFRELTKAFGQAEVRMRPKPPIVTRNPQQRHSEYIERPKVEIAAPKQNGFADSHVSSTTSPFGVNHVKRYTSVIGINNSNNNNNNNNNTSNININNKSHASSRQQTNFSHMNGQAIKPPPPPPVTAKPKEFSVPKPPTMPIITGVTLKSVNARPKSCGPTIQADPRDQLLESIRNFGGRNKLKSTGAAERY